MQLIPAIALRDGKCEGAGTIPGAGPAPQEALRIAAGWIAAGARRLHVVDDDAGVPGKRGGDEVIQALARAYREVPIQVAGNFRDGDEVGRCLGAGAEYVVLDSKAAAAGHFVNDLCLEYPGHVLMTMEPRTTATNRSKLARQPLAEAARRIQQEGVAGIVYRARADTGEIPDLAPAVELAKALTIPVQVCAGITSIEALRRVCMVAGGLEGAILDAVYRSEPPDFAAAVQLAGRVVAEE